MDEYGKVIENANLKNFTTLKVGGIAKYLVYPNSLSNFINLIKYLKKENIKYYILGNGSNVILDDSYFSGVIINLTHLDNMQINDNILTCECGIKLPFLVNKLIDLGYSNLGFLSMVPGTIGGATIGNAGCYNEEIFSFVKDVKVYDAKEDIIKILFKEDISYGYRYTSLKNRYIILSVSLYLNSLDISSVKDTIKMHNEKRMMTQPLEYPSVGSIFRNPEGASAGKLIEEAGLKGTIKGGAMISDKHANFIINYHDASFSDVIYLIDLCKEKVKEKFNIDLVLEPEIIKWK